MIRKIKQNKKRSHKKRTKDLWNTRCEIQIQTKLDHNIEYTPSTQL